jgi:hypothetical protein
MKVDAAPVPRCHQASVTKAPRYMCIPVRIPPPNRFNPSVQTQPIYVVGSQLPCPPSQTSLIPLYDGHILPSPAAEHNERRINSLPGLAEQLRLPVVQQQSPTLSFVTAATPRAPKRSTPLHALRCPPPPPRFPKHRTCVLDSKALTRHRLGAPPVRQSRVNPNGSSSLRSILVNGVPRRPSARINMTPLFLNRSYLPGSLFSHHGRWMSSYIVLGIVLTAGLGYYYASVFL